MHKPGKNLIHSPLWRLRRLRRRLSISRALVAARSAFVREQLRSTGGQTRPRIKAADLAAVSVPDPGAEAKALMDDLVGTAHQARLQARQTMDAVARLYEQFGRGEIDRDTLIAALKAH